MNKKLIAKKGFTLIELSISVVIVSLVLIALTSSEVLYSKITNLENILNSKADETQLNVVQSIPNLELWYNTTDPNSFVIDESFGKTFISSWNDVKNINTELANNAIQTVSSAKPRYIANAISSDIAGIKFNGVDDYLSFDGSFLVNTDYTIFIVEKKLQLITHLFLAG